MKLLLSHTHRKDITQSQLRWQWIIVECWNETIVKCCHLFQKKKKGWNAFMCSQVLWRQKRKHWHSTRLYREMFSTGKQSTTVCSKRAGRISRTTSTLCHGKYWITTFSSKLFFFLSKTEKPFWLLNWTNFWIVTHSNVTMTSNWKCHQIQMKVKSPNIQPNLSAALCNVSTKILRFFPSYLKRSKVC